MPNIIDETGHQYGQLTVIKREGTKRGQAAWLCQCSCGNTTIVAGHDLRAGNTKSCGCQKYKGLEIQNQGTIKIGDKFGKLTVIKELDLRPHGTQGHRRRWYLCQCECGNVCEAMGNILKTGRKVSCGCLSSKGEYYIEKILKQNNIIYNKDYALDELTNETGRRLRFDFVIYNDDGSINRFIEFDGNQHNSGWNGGVWGSNEENYKIIQERDHIKNDFCFRHNYTLIRIPYHKINTLCLDDIMTNKYKLIKIKKGGV